MDKVVDFPAGKTVLECVLSLCDMAERENRTVRSHFSGRDLEVSPRDLWWDVMRRYGFFEDRTKSPCILSVHAVAGLAVLKTLDGISFSVPAIHFEAMTGKRPEDMECVQLREWRPGNEQ